MRSFLMNELRESKLVAILWTPFIIGLLANVLCVKFGWLQRWQRPLDRGATLRGRRVFGANKTWRGVAVVAAGTAIGYALMALTKLLPGGVAPSLSIGQFALIGAVVGAAGMLSQLPGAFLKRQLDIAPGGAATGVALPLFWILDHVEILLGSWLVLGPIVGFTVMRLAWSVLWMAVLQQLVAFAGARQGMRAPAR